MKQGDSSLPCPCGPFLKTRTIQASLQSDGACPPSNEVWYILASIVASSPAAALRVNAGMVLNGFNPLTSMLGMLGYGLGPLSGKELVSSFVKTDTAAAVALEQIILVLVGNSSNFLSSNLHK